MSDADSTNEPQTTPAPRKKVTSKELLALCQRLQKKLKQSEARSAQLQDKCQSLEAQGEATIPEDTKQAVERAVALIKKQTRKETAELRKQITGLQAMVGDVRTQHALAQEAEEQALDTVTAKDKERVESVGRLEADNALLKKNLEETKRRLAQAFQLLKAEKGAGTEKHNLVAEAEGRLERQRTQVAALIERQEQQLMQSEHETKRLQKRVSELHTNVVRVELERDQLLEDNASTNELRTQLEVLKRESEQQQQALFQERNRREVEADMEAEERERDAAELERLKNKWHRQAKELEAEHARALARVEGERDGFKEAIEALQGQLERQTAQSADIVQTLSSKDACIEKLRKDIASNATKHKEALEAEGGRQYGKYENLMRELNVYRTRSAKVIAEQEQQLRVQREELAHLKEEIATGKPTERRIFQLAEQQSLRDDALLELQAQLVQLRTQRETDESELAEVRRERAELERNVQAHTNSRTRAQVNLDYLSSIMVQFLTSQQVDVRRKQLVPVIAKLLNFTPQQLKAVRLYESRAQPSWWTKVLPANMTEQTSPTT